MRTVSPRERTEAAIFVRLWERAPGGITASLAKHILKLGFDDEDQARVRDLLERNRESGLTPAEEQELDSYVKVGDLLAILQSKARRALKRPAPKPGRE
jgi:hypothetical protein